MFSAGRSHCRGLLISPQVQDCQVRDAAAKMRSGRKLANF